MYGHRIQFQNTSILHKLINNYHTIFYDKIVMNEVNVYNVSLEKLHEIESITLCDIE